MSILDDFEPRQPPRLSSILNWAIPLGMLLLLWIGGSIFANIYVDWLWFDNLGYLSVFTTILWTRVVLFILGALVFGALFAANVILAERYSPHGISPDAALSIPLEALTWARRLVLIGLVLAGVLLAIVFGAAASGYWETALRFTNAATFNLTDPLFNRDVSTYLFDLPFYRFLQGWGLGNRHRQRPLCGGHLCNQLCPWRIPIQRDPHAARPPVDHWRPILLAPRLWVLAERARVALFLTRRGVRRSLHRRHDQAARPAVAHCRQHCRRGNPGRQCLPAKADASARRGRRVVPGSHSGDGPLAPPPYSAFRCSRASSRWSNPTSSAPLR